MRTILKCAAAGLLLAGAAMATTGTASAAVGVTFDLGNVVVGYSDGYLDNHHQYHRWANAQDAARFRASHRTMYHSWRHDDRNHH